MLRSTKRAARVLVCAGLVACTTDPTVTAQDAGTVDASGIDTNATPGFDGGECDRDGDHHAALSCAGGDDCDDADPNRFPGRTEVCDVANHDEDCDPRTFGVRDGDGDSAADSLCCNLDGTAMHCGSDCDDTNASAHPGAPETCDSVDNDCDTAIDEALTSGLYYPDCDGDLFGAGTATTTAACAPPPTPPTTCGAASTPGWSTSGTDCDDVNPGIHPGAAELCTATDENCTGGGYDGLACVSGANEACMACDLPSTHVCSGSCAWDACVPSGWSVTWDLAMLTHSCGFALTDSGGTTYAWCATPADAGPSSTGDAGMRACWTTPSSLGPAISLPPGSYSASARGVGVLGGYPGEATVVDDTTGAVLPADFTIPHDANPCHMVHVGVRMGNCYDAISLRFVSP